MAHQGGHKASDAYGFGFGFIRASWAYRGSGPGLITKGSGAQTGRGSAVALDDEHWGRGAQASQAETAPRCRSAQNWNFPNSLNGCLRHTWAVRVRLTCRPS